MPKVVNIEERSKIRTKSIEIADELIRVGRAYIKCVTVPNRAQNQHEEANFADALADLIVRIVESDI